ncbi:hypothetical protein [Streptomyces fractus]|uniref:hypothetical protein n=1 Tax=Streptomyces fractus TaxID=641806 RepID=UPI003CEF60CB
MDTAPLPSSPLLAEMTALRAHSRQLGWLGEREQCPEQFQQLARSIVADLLEGWRAHTGGQGSLDDLIQPPAGPARLVPSARPGALMAQSQPRISTREFR